MDINEYLTMKCMYAAVSAYDSEFRTPTFSNEEEIPCFKYGDKVNLYTPDTRTTLSDQTYLLAQRVNPGDKIDGQIVKSCFEYHDFDGSNLLFEVKVALE